MFLDFYQLQEEPFGVTPDPRFLYLGDSHREALASLFYGIESDRGFMVLIAHPGFGKTTLIHQLIQKLQPDARTVFLFQTQCNSREMIQYLLNDLGVEVAGMDTVTMHNKLNEILTQERQAGRRFILIVDEAQNLEPSVLETIRLLSNFETSRSKLLQILLVGQPQLARKLASPALEQLQQRVSIFAKLEPFDDEETARYITHRLKVAGYTGSELFTLGAMNIIRDRSQGIPRNINRLCFSALSLGCAMGRKRIDADMMREVVADLELEPSEPVPAPKEISVPAVIEAVKTEPATPVLSYAAEPHNRKQPWVMGLTTVAASLLLVLGFLAYSHGKIAGRPAAKTEVAAPVRTLPPPAAQPGNDHPAPLTNAASVHPAPVAPLVETPSTAAANLPAPASDSAQTVKVVVRPGETLQQIALRHLGKDNSDLIKQIQQLNPSLKNPDHIEADQEIRLPLVSKATNLPLANALAGKSDAQQ